MHAALHIGNLSISNVYREESQCPTPTIGIGENTIIRQLIVNNVDQVNRTGKPIALLQNKGEIGKLYMRGLNVSEGDEVYVNNGKVDKEIID